MAKNKKRKKKNTAKMPSAAPQKNGSKLWMIGVVAAAIVICVVLGVLIAGRHASEPVQLTSATSQSDSDASAPQQQSQQPSAAKTEERYAVIDIANYGRITLELDPDTAPLTVANFVKLATSGFYDGLTFHRIMAGFMMQGGDPLGNGFGGSEETIKGEFAANGVENNISHTRGVISMARSNDPNSASSQFFIMHQDSTFLDGNYAAFGWVLDGIDVVDAVCADARPVDNNGTIPADQQPVINSITIYTDNPLG